jgi:hypothetical protein
VPTEYDADKVLLLRTGGRQPVYGIISEVQRGCDENKRYSWPLYTAALRARWRCPTCLVVLTLEEAVARWARAPIEDLQPGSPFTPLVLGPGQIPWVRTEQEARESPELAVLSAMAHGNEEGGLDVAIAEVVASAGLDEQRKRLYVDLVFHALTAQNLQRLMKVMDISNYQPQRELCRSWHQKGLDEGLEKGIQRGEARSLLRVLATRGIAVSEAAQQRILSCQDTSLLERWLDRAVTASSLDAVFADD